MKSKFSQTFRHGVCIAVLVLAIGGLQLINGQTGVWKNTIAAAVLNDRFYSVEKNGALYDTDLTTGKWVQIGKPEFGKTKFMFAAGQNLLTIETDGSLYRINPSSGGWTAVGDAGAWKGTIAGAFVSGRLCTIESDGVLYSTNPGTGVWAQIGKSEFARTQRLFGTSDALYSIESDGSLYWISPSDGTWRQIGEAGGWKNTIARTTLDGKIYTIETSGALYETNPATGKWKQIGKAEFAKTRFLFSANGSLYSLEDGNLYRINQTTGAWASVVR